MNELIVSFQKAYSPTAVHLISVSEHPDGAEMYTVTLYGSTDISVWASKEELTQLRDKLTKILD